MVELRHNKQQHNNSPLPATNNKQKEENIMGADLILVFPAMPHTKENDKFKPIYEFDDTLQTVAVNRLALRTEDELRWIDALEHKYENALADADNLDFDDLTREMMVEIILNVIKEAMETIDNRDVVIINLDKPRLFSGGMSWGDEPSESFQILNELASIGLFEDPIAPSELA